MNQNHAPEGDDLSTDEPEVNEPEGESPQMGDASEDELEFEAEEGDGDDEEDSFAVAERESEAPDFAEETPSEDAERVSKLIARAGLASRRAAEEIITEGRVSINGHFVREPGAKADPARDRIVVDGKPLVFAEKTTTVVLLHKPKYVVTTRDDQGKRTTVMDLLPYKLQKLHPVGRLDYETTGVLLLSDDGELTNLLTHPSHGVEKVYEARVRGEVTKQDIERLEGGLYLEDGKTAPCRARVLAQREKNALVELSLREGRNRQARRMFDAIGHPASSLRRVKFAGIELEGLEVGAYRVLLPGEVKQLRKHAESALKDAKKEAKKRAAPPRKPRFGKPGGSKPTATAVEGSTNANRTGNGSRSATSGASDRVAKGPNSRSAGARPNEERSPRGTRPGMGNQSTTGNPRSSAPRPAVPKAPRSPRGATNSEGTPAPAPKRTPNPKDDKSALAKRIEKKWR